MSWLQAGIGAVELIENSAEKSAASTAARKNEANRPLLKKDVTQDQNLSLVKSDLSNGLSERADKAYNDVVDREFSSSLSSLLKGGGDVNSIGDLYGNTEAGRQKLSMFRDNLRLNQINNLITQSKITDDRNTISPFQVNEFAPFQDRAAATGAARAGAAKKENDAFNTLISGLGQEYGNMTEKNKYGLGKTDQFKEAYGTEGQYAGAESYAKRNNMDFNEYDNRYNENLKTLSRIL